MAFSAMSTVSLNTSALGSPSSWAACYPFCEEIPRDAQSESALVPTEPISSHPVAGCLGEKRPTPACLQPPGDNSTPEPPFLQAIS